MNNHIINFIKNINWNKLGLISVIIQDVFSKNILMLAWMNKKTLLETIITKKTVFWSRSKNRIWRKGEYSKCIQKVYKIFLDCDKDCILILIYQINNKSCHMNNYSCFNEFIKIYE